MGFDFGAAITTLAVVIRVSVLVIDVIDAINQQIERKRHPNQEGNDGPGPEFSRQPHTDDSGPNSVDPQHGTRDFNEAANHFITLAGAPFGPFTAWASVVRGAVCVA